jgi:tyrosyl-tRNA synthetase
MEIKKLIAHNLVAQYHGDEFAASAVDFFVKQFQSKKLEEKAFEEVSAQTLREQFGEQIKLVDLCHFLKGATKSAMRRLIIGGAVQIDSIKQLNPELMLDLNTCFKIKLGKRAYFRVI